MSDAEVPTEILINVDVPDLEAGIAFYEAGLGFARDRLLFNDTVAEMSLGGTRVFLIQHKAGSIAVPGTALMRDYRIHWTPVHLDIVVDDLDAAVARAVAAGAERPAAIGRHEWGDIATLRDPFGHGFCLIAFQGRGYDAAEAK
ncbi:MAG: VOC family protein [Rhodospirillales bacterium]